jgi:hypothetical protein
MYQLYKFLIYFVSAAQIRRSASGYGRKRKTKKKEKKKKVGPCLLEAPRLSGRSRLGWIYLAPYILDARFISIGLDGQPALYIIQSA